MRNADVTKKQRQKIKILQSKRVTEISSSCPFTFIRHHLRKYATSQQQPSLIIDDILGKCSNSRTIRYKDIVFNYSNETLEKVFQKQQQQIEISQLVEYYKFYKNCPIIKHKFFMKFMINYWDKVKIVYYKKIKKILQLEQPSSTIEKNDDQNDSFESIQFNNQSNSTFYVINFIKEKNEIKRQEQIPQSQNQTLQSLLENLKAKKKKQFKTAQRDIKKQSTISLLKQNQNSKESKLNKYSHLITSCSAEHLISVNSTGKRIQKKLQKKNFHKSISTENQQFLSDKSKQKKKKKLNTVFSCQLISKNHKNSNKKQKEVLINQEFIKNKKKSIGMKRKSQTSINRDNHKISQSKKSQKSIDKKSPAKINIKQMANIIKKVKNKIKEEKTVMIKQYIESRQSYIKSIDSTCGEVNRKDKNK